MSTLMFIANHTKKEGFSLGDIGGGTAWEILIRPLANLVVTSYLLDNPNDHITFVPDHDEEFHDGGKLTYYTWIELQPMLDKTPSRSISVQIF